MNFALTAPCSDCPFLREGGVRVRPARAAQIAADLLDHKGKTFACHKTTGAAGGPRMEHSHCAGALIFVHKHDQPAQIHLVAERLGLYDRANLQGWDRVFDTAEEMLAVQIP